jgi:uncharacterized membrane protein YeaQ/YmgE (transglycosylase-associated protein family)
MLSILGWIIFGLIIGALAKLLMPGRDPGGIIVTLVLGIVGAARRFSRARLTTLIATTSEICVTWKIMSTAPVIG